MAGDQVGGKPVLLVGVSARVPAVVARGNSATLPEERDDEPGDDFSHLAIRHRDGREARVAQFGPVRITVDNQRQLVRYGNLTFLDGAGGSDREIATTYEDRGGAVDAP